MEAHGGSWGWDQKSVLGSQSPHFHAQQPFVSDDCTGAAAETGSGSSRFRAVLGPRVHPTSSPPQQSPGLPVVIELRGGTE